MFDQQKNMTYVPQIFEFDDKWGGGDSRQTATHPLPKYKKKNLNNI